TLGPELRVVRLPGRERRVPKVGWIANIIVSQAADQPQAIDGLKGEVAIASPTVEVFVNRSLSDGISEERRKARRRVGELSPGPERPALPSAAERQREAVPLKELV